MTRTDPSTLPIAVVGATGQQGRAVVESLLAAGVPVRAVVRDPNADKARALAERGVEVVRADQEDRADLTAAFTGAGALFMMTTFSGEDGVEGEVRRGRTVADAAVQAGVPRIVYSSVGGAERQTGIPHFESKRRVEEHLAATAPAVFVRPVFFMDNLLTPLVDRSGSEVVIRMPMPADVSLQLVAVADIGRVAARLLLDPDALGGADAVEIGGDSRTPADLARLVGEHEGTTARFEQVPAEALGDDDLAAMYRWFTDTPAYAADFALTRRLDPEVLDLPAWLAQH